MKARHLKRLSNALYAFEQNWGIDTEKALESFGDVSVYLSSKLPDFMNYAKKADYKLFAKLESANDLLSSPDGNKKVKGRLAQEIAFETVGAHAWHSAEQDAIGIPDEKPSKAALLFSAAAVYLLSGCGDSPQEENPSIETTTSDGEPTDPSTVEKTNILSLPGDQDLVGMTTLDGSLYSVYLDHQTGAIEGHDIDSGKKEVFVEPGEGEVITDVDISGGRIIYHVRTANNPVDLTHEERINHYNLRTREITPIAVSDLGLLENNDLKILAVGAEGSAEEPEDNVFYAVRGIDGKAEIRFKPLGGENRTIEQGVDMNAIGKADASGNLFGYESDGNINILTKNGDNYGGKRSKPGSFLTFSGNIIGIIDDKGVSVGENLDGLKNLPDSAGAVEVNLLGDLAIYSKGGDLFFNDGKESKKILDGKTADVWFENLVNKVVQAGVTLENQETDGKDIAYVEKVI